MDEQERAELAAESDSWEETDVAIVVYVRSRGVDVSDAQSRAELAVRMRLGDERGIIEPLDLYHTGHTVLREGVLPVADVKTLRGADLIVSPASTPFRYAGLGRPRSAGE